MGYLISQIIFCLIAAAVLGVALGWLLHGMLHHQDDVEPLKQRLSEALDDNHRLRAKANAPTNTAAPVAHSPGPLPDTQEPTHASLEPIETNPPAPTLADAEPEMIALKDSAPDNSTHDLAQTHDGLSDTSEVAKESLQNPFGPQSVKQAPLGLAGAVAEARSRRAQTSHSTPIPSDVTSEFEDKNRLEDAPSDEGTGHSYPLTEIKAIGVDTREKLGALDIHTTRDLLFKGHSPVDRANISEKTQIETFVVKKWIAQADLLRVDGVSSDFARLLQASHVDSVEDLASKEAFTLLGTMKAVNLREKLTAELPDPKMVEHWIQSARSTTPLT